MASFGRSSLQRKSTCDSELQSILDEAIKEYDFSVICGYRNEEDQNAAYESGASNARWGESKHNEYPSKAVDIAPYPIDWDDKERFTYLATIIFKVAAEKGIKIKWGGHFKKINDMPHFELVN